MAVPQYPRPPFKPQQQGFPGKTDRMDPRPDHGEDSYVGHDLLVGKRALVTGGDSGIGAAVAIAFAREGADVAIAYLASERHDAERILQHVRDAGRNAFGHACDICDPEQAAELVRKTVDALGGLDILVNNAAYQKYFHSFEEITLEEWVKTFATNVHAPFNLVRLALPHLRDGGSIINTASVQAKKPRPAILPYATTKGAIANMTIGLAGMLAEEGIRVNAVLPGPIWTPLIPAGMAEEEVANFGGHVPMGRPGQPVELASAYVMLAADTASYTSGALLNVSGGSVTL